MKGHGGQIWMSCTSTIVILSILGAVFVPILMLHEKLSTCYSSIPLCKKLSIFYQGMVKYLTRPIRPTMRPLAWWNDCMMMWLMTCSAWLQFIEKGQFSLNFTKAWQTDQLTDWPSYRDAGMHPKICSGLFMAFPGFQMLKNIDFPCFLQKRHQRTNGRTDGRADGRAGGQVRL